jgi:hypothetical protein
MSLNGMRACLLLLLMNGCSSGHAQRLEVIATAVINNIHFPRTDPVATDNIYRIVSIEKEESGGTVTTRYVIAKSDSSHINLTYWPSGVYATWNSDTLLLFNSAIRLFACFQIKGTSIDKPNSLYDFVLWNVILWHDFYDPDTTYNYGHLKEGNGRLIFDNISRGDAAVSPRIYSHVPYVNGYVHGWVFQTLKSSAVLPNDMVSVYADSKYTELPCAGFSLSQIRKRTFISRIECDRYKAYSFDSRGRNMNARFDDIKGLGKRTRGNDIDSEHFDLFLSFLIAHCPESYNSVHLLERPR